MKKKVISKEEILHLAKLSQLHITDQEIEKYWKQLEETAEYIKNLDELNISEVSPTSQTTSLTSVMFDDGKENKRSLTQKGYFIVKKIL